MRRRVLGGKGNITLSKSSGTVYANSGASDSFTVKYNNVLVTASTSEITITKDESWITTAWTSSNGTVTVTCAENTSTASTRSATITVSYKDADPKTYTITQRQRMITLSPTSASVDAASGSNTTFTVAYNGSNLTANSISVSSNQTWVQTAWTASSSTVKLSTKSKNTTNNARTATITVTYNQASATFTFTQKGPELSLSPSSNTVSYDVSSTTFNVLWGGEKYTGSSSNVTLSASTTSVTTSYSSGTVTIGLSPNVLNSTRTINVKVTLNNQDKTFTLVQSARSGAAPLGVLFVNKSTQQKLAVQSGETWPNIQEYEPIGVIIPSLTRTAVGIKFLNMTTDDYLKNGATYIQGYDSQHTLLYLYITGTYNSDYDVLNLPTTSGTPLTTRNGKENTSKFIQMLDNKVGTSWKTMNSAQLLSKFDDGGDWPSQYSLIAATYHFSPIGTNKGDWYIPSIGEAYELARNITAAQRACYLIWKYYGDDVINSSSYLSDFFYVINNLKSTYWRSGDAVSGIWIIKQNNTLTFQSNVYGGSVQNAPLFIKY